MAWRTLPCKNVLEVSCRCSLIIIVVLSLPFSSFPFHRILFSETIHPSASSTLVAIIIHHKHQCYHCCYRLWLSSLMIRYSSSLLGRYIIVIIGTLIGPFLFLSLFLKPRFSFPTSTLFSTPSPYFLILHRPHHLIYARLPTVSFLFVLSLLSAFVHPY